MPLRKIKYLCWSIWKPLLDMPWLKFVTPIFKYKVTKVTQISRLPLPTDELHKCGTQNIGKICVIHFYLHAFTRPTQTGQRERSYTSDIYRPNEDLTENYFFIKTHEIFDQGKDDFRKNFAHLSSKARKHHFLCHREITCPFLSLVTCNYHLLTGNSFALQIVLLTNDDIGHTLTECTNIVMEYSKSLSHTIVV